MPSRRLRAREYARLDAQDQVYLDYTGGGLYAESQLREHLALLSQRGLRQPALEQPDLAGADATWPSGRARPCSTSSTPRPTSTPSIFTANASGALKLVGEAYPVRRRASRFPLTADNHNSVNGIREFARARGAEVTYLPLLAPELRLGRAPSVWRAARPAPDPAGAQPLRLPGPVQLLRRAAPAGLDRPTRRSAAGTCCSTPPPSCRPTGWTCRRWHPDFVAVSWYKVFGYPTGVGCLIVRARGARPAAPALVRRRHDQLRVGAAHRRATSLAEGETGFEDGTVNYLGLPAVEIGLRHIARDRHRRRSTGGSHA